MKNNMSANTKEQITVDNFGKAIYNAVTNQGIEILDDLSRIKGYLLDTNPEFKKEIHIFSKTFNKEYLKIYKDAFKQELNISEKSINKLRYYFSEKEGIANQWIDILCTNCWKAILYYKGKDINNIDTENKINENQSYNQIKDSLPNNQIKTNLTYAQNKELSTVKVGMLKKEPTFDKDISLNTPLTCYPPIFQSQLPLNQSKILKVSLNIILISFLVLLGLTVIFSGEIMAMIILISFYSAMVVLKNDIILYGLNKIRGKNTSRKDFFSQCNGKIIKMVLSEITKSLCVVIGSLLWGVGSIFPFYWFRLSTYIIKEENLGPIESLIRSKQLLKNHYLSLFILDLKNLGWIILTTITFGAASIYTVPRIARNYALFYNNLRVQEMNNTLTSV